jgi:hypothetical protein
MPEPWRADQTPATAALDASPSIADRWAPATQFQASIAAAAEAAEASPAAHHLADLSARAEHSERELETVHAPLARLDAHAVELERQVRAAAPATAASAARHCAPPLDDSKRQATRSIEGVAVSVWVWVCAWGSWQVWSEVRLQRVALVELSQAQEAMGRLRTEYHQLVTRTCTRPLAAPPASLCHPRAPHSTPVSRRRCWRGRCRWLCTLV